MKLNAGRAKLNGPTKVLIAAIALVSLAAGATATHLKAAMAIAHNAEAIVKLQEMATGIQQNKEDIHQTKLDIAVIKTRLKLP